MKIIITTVLMFTHMLFTMEKSIENQLQNLGIKISRIDVSPSELGHIRVHQTKETLNYLANCSDGLIMATFDSKQDKISCKKKIICLSDGTEGVYQRCSERDIDSAHYHLLRILYDVQEEKSLLEKIQIVQK